MQAGGFGGPPGGQGPGQPPGYPPGAGGPYGAPNPYGSPGAAPAAPQAPGQYSGAAHPGAAHPGAAYPGAGQVPGAYPGQVPGGYPGAAYPGAGQFPGAAAGMPQGYPGMPQAGAMPGAAAYGGITPGQQPGAAAHNPYGQAQKALAGAGGMMKIMKYAFIGVGALCIVLGVVLLITVDVMTGIMTAVTGGIFAGVALLVLPRFTGMVGDATAMVDGFAAKAQLAQTGVPAGGRLLQVQQTGRLVNYNPEIQALVEVHHPQLGVYQTQTTAIVQQIAIPRAQPGAQVQVRVNPQNQHDIALVF